MLYFADNCKNLYKILDAYLEDNIDVFFDFISNLTDTTREIYNCPLLVKKYLSKIIDENYISYSLLLIIANNNSCLDDSLFPDRKYKLINKLVKNPDFIHTILEEPDTLDFANLLMDITWLDHASEIITKNGLIDNLIDVVIQENTEIEFAEYILNLIDEHIDSDDLNPFLLVLLSKTNDTNFNKIYNKIKSYFNDDELLELFASNISKLLGDHKSSLLEKLFKFETNCDFLEKITSKTFIDNETESELATTPCGEIIFSIFNILDV